MQEPPKSILEQLSNKHPKKGRASSRSSFQGTLIHGICNIFLQGPLGGFQQDLHKIFKGLCKILIKSFIRRYQRESHKIIKGGPAIERTLHDLCTRTSSEHRTRAFIEAPPIDSFCEICMQGPPGGFRKDLNNILSQGPDPARTS